MPAPSSVTSRRASIHARSRREALAPRSQRCTIRAGAPVQLAVSVGRLDPTVEVAVYFVCSEALANVGKYAEASHVTVDVARSDEHVVLSIEDDGIGGADTSRGSGLRGLADRVEALGGQLSVRSPMGGGTRLDATIPVDAHL